MKIYKVKHKEELRKIIDNSAPDADLNYLDVSGITDMSGLFEDSSFNGDISSWDVSSVTDMQWMFQNSSFNGDISNWDVSNVTDMRYMFANSKFNQDISGWNVSNVVDMSWMFEDSNFTGDISRWSNKPIQCNSVGVEFILDHYDMIDPLHYKNYTIETIEMMVRIWGSEKVAIYCELTAFKYRSRMGIKPGNSLEQDFKKEKWYLDKSKQLRNDIH